MNLHPDPAISCIQLQGSDPTGDMKMPMAAALAVGQLTFTSNDQAIAPALLECLSHAELEIEFEQVEPDRMSGQLSAEKVARIAKRDCT
jgi:hypothetical protein